MDLEASALPRDHRDRLFTVLRRRTKEGYVHRHECCFTGTPCITLFCYICDGGGINGIGGDSLCAHVSNVTIEGNSAERGIL